MSAASGEVWDLNSEMPVARLYFPKSARLSQAREFAKLKAEGRSYHGKFMVLSVLRVLPAEVSRVGFVTSRRVGGAVVRNRVRRRLREIVRVARPGLAAGLWLVLIARRQAAAVDFAALREEWVQLGERGSIFACS